MLGDDGWDLQGFLIIPVLYSLRPWEIQTPVSGGGPNRILYHTTRPIVRNINQAVLHGGAVAAIIRHRATFSAARVHLGAVGQGLSQPYGVAIWAAWPIVMRDERHRSLARSDILVFA